MNYINKGKTDAPKNSAEIANAKILKETPKAFFVQYNFTDRDGETYKGAKSWLPKSQIREKYRQGQVIYFEPIGSCWILNCCIENYCKWVAKAFPQNVKPIIKSIATYGSRIDNACDFFYQFVNTNGDTIILKE